MSRGEEEAIEREAQRMYNELLAHRRASMYVVQSERGEAFKRRVLLRLGELQAGNFHVRHETGD